MRCTVVFPALLSMAWKLGAVFPRNVRCAALLVWLMMMPFYVLLRLFGGDGALRPNSATTR